MDNFPEYANIPLYKELREKQKINNQVLDDENMEPLFFDNFLSKEELSYIQKQFNNISKESIKVKKWGGQGVIGGNEELFVPKSIIDRVEYFASKAYGEELEVMEVGPVRYSPDYGWEVKLAPHYDTKSIQIFVFDLQIMSTEKWNIVIEGKSYELSDGQAIMFSGTNQIHWRESIKFKDNSEICLIFFPLKHKKERKFTEEHNLIMSERQKVLVEETNIKHIPKKILNNDDDTLDIKSTLNYVSRYGNIFTESEIDSIYNLIDSGQFEKDKTIYGAGQIIYFPYISKNLKSKIYNQMLLIYNQPVTLQNVCLIKYFFDDVQGPTIKPNYSNITKTPLVNLSVQLRSNINWPLIIDNVSYALMDNESIAFSATQKRHWRDEYKFKKGDFLDMILFDFSLDAAIDNEMRYN